MHTFRSLELPVSLVAPLILVQLREYPSYPELVLKLLCICMLHGKWVLAAKYGNKVYIHNMHQNSLYPSIIALLQLHSNNFNSEPGYT